MTRTLTALCAASLLFACSKDSGQASANSGKPAVRVSSNEAPAVKASDEAGEGAVAAKADAKRDPADHGKFTRLHANPKDGALVDLLTAAKKRADAEGRKLFVELGADWCEPCQAIEKYIDDPKMAEAFAGTLVIKLDVGPSWDGQLEKHGMDSGTIPIWYQLDDDLKATDHVIDGGAWGANIPKNMAGPLGDYFAGKDVDY